MKLQIDNLDGNGAIDYSMAIDGMKPPQVVRKLNVPAELQCSLLADGPEFVAPANGARITLAKTQRTGCVYRVLSEASGIRVPGMGGDGAGLSLQPGGVER